MPCVCNTGKYVVTAPASGDKPARTLEYTSRTEASAAARRLGGTYQKVS